MVVFGKVEVLPLWRYGSKRRGRREIGVLINRRWLSRRPRQMCPLSYGTDVAQLPGGTRIAWKLTRALQGNEVVLLVARLPRRAALKVARLSRWALRLLLRTILPGRDW